MAFRGGIPAGGAPGGAAGGVLSGTYPNPGMAAGAAATNVGTVAGDLTGTLPNPTLAAIVAAAGPIGSATTVPVVTIDAKGRVTALTSAAIVAGSKVYLNKPAGNITRAATSVGAFSTAWQITGVVVAAGQNVRLRMCAAHGASVLTNDRLFAFLRGSTQVAAWNLSGTSADNGPFTTHWIDENPGAGTYTYEVQAAMFTAGTLTVYQQNPTSDVTGGSSIFVAEVYTP